MADGKRGAGHGRRPGIVVVLARGVLFCAGRLGRVVYEGLRAAGSMWVYVPPDDEYDDHDAGDAGDADQAVDATGGGARPRILDAPPEGHPERLPARTSPSPEEQDLWARFYADD
ncbi:DUF6059 family protein [Streptomyces sp. CRN 30]|uniref:DUF6059 family protein n=1 Tax=Streptomyces sp. CRN 30 TaxID=3075613 RepID=UPI002A82C1BC|nr:DUF6059 family protein [Streptomyces sp. CRN 30]